MTRLIDADAIKYTMLYKEDWLKGTGTEAQGVWKKDIDAMPTADAVRYGKWLSKHHYIAGYEFASGYICSECGNDALNAEGDDFLTDYCPNCGAKMYETQKKPCDVCQEFDCYGCDFAERKEE